MGRRRGGVGYRGEGDGGGFLFCASSSPFGMPLLSLLSF